MNESLLPHDHWRPLSSRICGSLGREFQADYHPCIAKTPAYLKEPPRYPVARTGSRSLKRRVPRRATSFSESEESERRRRHAGRSIWGLMTRACARYFSSSCVSRLSEERRPLPKSISGAMSSETPKRKNRALSVARILSACCNQRSSDDTTYNCPLPVLGYWGYHRQGSCQAGLGAAISKVSRTMRLEKSRAATCPAKFQLTTESASNARM